MEIGRILASSLTDGRALLPPDGLPLLIETLGASYKPGRGGGGGGGGGAQHAAIGTAAAPLHHPGRGGRTLLVGLVTGFARGFPDQALASHVQRVGSMVRSLAVARAHRGITGLSSWNRDN